MEPSPRASISSDVPSGPRAPIRTYWLKPAVPVDPEALTEIREADLIVLGPQ